MSNNSNSLVITFAGDSGDGIQLLGNLFADNVAQLYFDLNTNPEFPAEIRAPANTLDGVSSFKIKWGSERIYTSGNHTDILVSFNPASLSKYTHLLKPNSIVIYDEQGFSDKNFKKHGRETFDSLTQTKIGIDITKNTLMALSEVEIDEKSKFLHKNIYTLGYLLFGLGASLDYTRSVIEKRFSRKPIVAECQNICLKAGYIYGEVTDFHIPKFETQKTVLEAGEYLNISGNEAIAMALSHVPAVFGNKLLFSGYPITPASDILHYMSKFRLEELTVLQAEDEIAAIGNALGASYGGAIGVCASSGPGISLKQETISLAHMTETPLLIIDVQRAGPSTGMPTKVEQGDLYMSLFGRHGDAPIPVIAITSPSHAYSQTLDAIEVMIKHNTPVILLSDAQIAIGSELMKVPEISKRNISLKGLETIKVKGGLEKDKQTGKVSYDGTNHTEMMAYRKHKIEEVKDSIKDCEIIGNSDKNLIITWGCGYNVVNEFIDIHDEYSHINLSWILPLPKNFDSIIDKYENIYVVELNSGQLYSYLKSLDSKTNYISITKQEGKPFFVEELEANIIS